MKYPPLTEGRLLARYIGLDRLGRCCSQIGARAITWTYRSDAPRAPAVYSPLCAEYIVDEAAPDEHIPVAKRHTQVQKNTIAIILDQQVEHNRRGLPSCQ